MVEGPRSNLKLMSRVSAAGEKGFCTINAAELNEEDGTEWNKKLIILM